MKNSSLRSWSKILPQVGPVSLLLACFFMMSCKDDDPAEEVKPDKYLSASVAGKAFTAATVTSKVASNGNAVFIEGVGSDGTLIQINLNLTDTKAGQTYNVGLHQNGWYKDQTATYFFDDGTITINVLSNNLAEGTFTVEGEATDDSRIVIQQGKFKSAYVK